MIYGDHAILLIGRELQYFCLSMEKKLNLLYESKLLF